MLPLVLALFLQTAPLKPVPTPETDYRQSLNEIKVAIEGNKPKDFSNDLSNLKTAIEKKDWGEPAVLVAIGGLIVTAGSLILLAWTGILTRRMQEAATEQARLAKQQADSAGETQKTAIETLEQARLMLNEAKRQNQIEYRPLILIDEEHGDRVPLNPGLPTMSFKVMNYGRSPALSVKVFELFNGHRKELPYQFPIIASKSKTFIHVQLTYLASNEKPNLSMYDFCQRVINDDIHPITIHIDYEDIAKGSWRSSYQYRAVPGERMLRLHLLDVIETQEYD